jgi:hypothetical protein
MNCLNTLLVYPFDFEWVLSVVKHGTVIDRQRAYRYRLLPEIKHLWLLPKTEHSKQYSSKSSNFFGVSPSKITEQ